MAIGAAEIVIEINLLGMGIDGRWRKFELITKLLSQGLREDGGFQIEHEFENQTKPSGKIFVGRLYVATVRISNQEKDWFDNAFKQVVSELCGNANIVKFACSWLM